MKDLIKGFIQGAKHKLDTEEPRDDFFNEILQKMDESNSAKRKPIRLFRPLWIAVAASLSLVLVFIFLLPNMDSGNEIISGQIDEPNKIINPAVHEPIVNPDHSEDIADLADPDHSSSPLNNHGRIIKNYIKSYPTPQFPETKSRDTFYSNSESLISDLAIANNANNKNTSNHSRLTNPYVAEESNNSTESTLKKADPPIIAESLEPLSQNVIEGVATNSTNGITDEEQSISEEAIEEDQSLGTYVKKGLIQFIKQRAKKITGDVIALKQHQEEDQKVLALKFKSPHLEFSRTIPWGDSRD